MGKTTPHVPGAHNRYFFEMKLAAARFRISTPLGNWVRFNTVLVA
jgi:hypothetical protein